MYLNLTKDNFMNIGSSFVSNICLCPNGLKINSIKFLSNGIEINNNIKIIKIIFFDNLNKKSESEIIDFDLTLDNYSIFLKLKYFKIEVENLNFDEIIIELSETKKLVYRRQII